MEKSIKRQKIIIVLLVLANIVLAICASVFAAQKMSLKMTVSIDPTFLCKIVCGDTTLFCNTTENGEVVQLASGVTLSGNNLHLSKDLTTRLSGSTQLGASFDLTIYNYADFRYKITVENTEHIAYLNAYAGSGEANHTTLENVSSTGTAIKLLVEYIAVYQVSSNSSGGNFTLNGTTSIDEENDYVARLDADVGYVLPETLTITSGAKTLVQGQDFAWDSTTKRLTIYKASYAGDISINCQVIVGVLKINVYEYDDGSSSYYLERVLTVPNFEEEFTIGFTWSPGTSINDVVGILEGDYTITQSGLRYFITITNWNNVTGDISIYWSSGES